MACPSASRNAASRSRSFIVRRIRCGGMATMSRSQPHDPPPPVSQPEREPPGGCPFATRCGRRLIVVASAGYGEYVKRHRLADELDELLALEEDDTASGPAPLSNDASQERSLIG
jgi:hypothetical protein